MENDDDVCFWILSDENGLGTRKENSELINIRQHYLSFIQKKKIEESTTTMTVYSIIKSLKTLHQRQVNVKIRKKNCQLR